MQGGAAGAAASQATRHRQGSPGPSPRAAAAAEERLPRACRDAGQLGPGADGDLRGHQLPASPAARRGPSAAGPQPGPAGGGGGLWLRQVGAPAARRGGSGPKRGRCVRGVGDHRQRELASPGPGGAEAGDGDGGLLLGLRLQRAREGATEGE
eukprot:7958738-Pyramimonas_sp.AAC.1